MQTTLWTHARMLQPGFHETGLPMTSSDSAASRPVEADEHQEGPSRVRAAWDALLLAFALAEGEPGGGARAGGARASLGIRVERDDSDALPVVDEDVAREIETARGKVELERALPEYRKVMAERRERILKSITDLSAALDKLRDQIMESFNELKKTEQTILNRQQRQRTAQRRRDQLRADEIGLDLHRRKKDTSL